MAQYYQNINNINKNIQQKEIMKKTEKQQTILVADVGGTKTDIALALSPASPSDTGYTLCHQARFSNDDSSAPEELFAKYLNALPAELRERERAACFAIAGPVAQKEGEISRLTNREWFFEPASFEKRFALSKLIIINDLTALSYAVPTMTQEELFSIQQAEVDKYAASAILAPGTGLGEGVLCRDRAGEIIAWGCEGGHTDFGAVSEEQAQLLVWAQQEMEHVSYEAFLCGSGLVRLYRFAVEELGIVPQQKVEAAIEELRAKKSDGAAAVSAGFAAGCPACTKSMELFMDILGSEAGNLALKLLARGGVYIGGGMLPRFYKEIGFAGFRRAFCNKGKMAELMKEMPVYLMLAERSNLRGAAYYAGRRFLEKTV